MTKRDLIQRISARTGQPPHTISVTVEVLMEEVKAAVAKGHRLDLRGFGTFMRKHRKEKKARKGRMLTDTTIIPAHDEPVFQASDAFRYQVNSTQPQAETEA